MGRESTVLAGLHTCRRKVCLGGTHNPILSFLFLFRFLSSRSTDYHYLLCLKDIPHTCGQFSVDKGLNAVDKLFVLQQDPL